MFTQLRYTGSPKILEKDSLLSFFTNKTQEKFKRLLQWQSFPTFFTTGKLTSFLSQEIIKQQQFTRESHRQAESKQRCRFFSCPWGSGGESCIRSSNRNKTHCPFLVFTVSDNNICSVPLAVWVSMNAPWLLIADTQQAEPEDRRFHQQIKQVSCRR